MTTFYRDYVAMDDPQWLAHAIMLGSLTLLTLPSAMARLRAGRARYGQITLAAVLMVTGGFVKHTLVALPFATALWLRPRAGLVWILAAMLAVAAGLAATDALFGQDAFTDIFRHRRIVRLHLLTRAISHLALLLPAAALLLRRRVAGDGAILVALFGTIALVTGTLQRSGGGVYYNAHFETMIAVCLGVGLVLDPRSLATRPVSRRGFGPSLVLFLAVSPILGAMPWYLPIAWHSVTGCQAREGMWRPLIARLAAARGPVGCEMPSVCYWAGKSFSLDPFNLTQSALSGDRS